MSDVKQKRTGSTPAQRTAANSLWLIAQPLLLNVISVFVTGFIARTLGQADYGKFTFAFAFVTLFLPIVNPGLRAITVRGIAKSKEAANAIAGKILTLRFFLSLCAVVIIAIMVNMLKYPPATRIAVYIASLTIILRAITTSLEDVFQAFEKMKYVAYTRFISGVTLTALSVIILLIGYRLFGVCWVYVAGQFVGMLIAFRLLNIHFIKLRLSIDVPFWKESIVKGLPFFVPGLLSTIGNKIGILFLSIMASDVSVGIFGAANNLISRLLIIPDGVGTSIFPTLAALYKTSHEKAIALFRKFFLYMVMLGLPVALGVAILARPIILLIYGEQYVDAIAILQLLTWGLLIKFVNAIQSWALAAIHLEKKGAMVSFIVVPTYVTLNLILIPHFQAKGTALASIGASGLAFILFSFFIRKHFTAHVIEMRNLIKVLVANLAMGAVVYMLRHYMIIVPICAGILIYGTAVLGFGLITKRDIGKLVEMFVRRRMRNAH